MALGFRHQEIIDAARGLGKVTVDGLAERFGVTRQTIRRDLNELCDKGFLARVHGGAILPSGVANLGYDARRDLAAEEKAAIGRLCAENIPDNASLFINIGTTTEAVARALLGHQHLMVVTNNLNVATILAENPYAEVIVTGGMLRRPDNALVGEATIDCIRQFRVDYAVIGASAIDPDGTLLDFDYREVRAAQAIMEHARATFLVADHSKMSRKAPVRIGHIAQISTLFTDPLGAAAIDALCHEAGVMVRATGPYSRAAAAPASQPGKRIDAKKQRVRAKRDGEQAEAEGGGQDLSA
ncbi:MAG: DeoR/GlpR family DNA-binding transcription regulator [Geminicoccaceae bacterium]